MDPTEAAQNMESSSDKEILENDIEQQASTSEEKFEGEPSEDEEKSQKEEVEDDEEVEIQEVERQELPNRKAIDIKMPMQPQEDADDDYGEDFEGDEEQENVKDENENVEKSSEDGKGGAEEEEIDIDLEDPDVEVAATKIQAGFKGMKARKEMRKRNGAEDGADDELKDEILPGNLDEQEDEEINQLINISQSRKAIAEDVTTTIDEVYPDRNKGMEEVPETDDRIATDSDHAEDQDMANDQEDMGKVDLDEDYDQTHDSESKVNINQDENDQVNVSKTDQDQDDQEHVSKTNQDEEDQENVGKTEQGEGDQENIGKPDNKEDNQENIGNADQDEVDDEDYNYNDDEDDFEVDIDDVMAQSRPKEDKEDKVDIDLEDPDVGLAATRIQAGYKGMRTRKEMRERRGETGETEQSHQRIDEENAETQNNSDEVDKEDEIDIDLNDPDVERAATKIQAGFKGHKARKRVHDIRNNQINDDETEAVEVREVIAEGNTKEDDDEIDIDLNDPDVEQAATKIQAGFKGHKARAELRRKQILKDRENVPKSLEAFNRQVEDEIVDIDLNDPGTEKAATTIQAGYKGMRARKEFQNKKVEYESKRNSIIPEEAEDEEVVDIDLDDPDVELAATKIQAGFKGHRARKEIRDKRKAGKVIEEEERENIDIDLNDPDLEQAATKIQAGYKGMRTRRNMRSENNLDSGNNEKETDIGDEEVDIDLEDPDVERAATKIQAGYKGMLTRKQMRSSRDKKNDDLIENNGGNLEDVKAPSDDVVDIDLDDEDVQIAATRIQAGYKGMKTRKEMKSRYNLQSALENGSQSDEIIDIDLNDPNVEQAATKIQAGFKGHRARKELKTKKEMKSQLDLQNVVEAGGNEKEIIDIDLNDPEVEQAATKIQAGFKGLRARKDMKKKREMKSQLDLQSAVEDGNDDDDDEVIDIDLNDPHVEQAATKIQAGFKGHRARKEVAARRQSISQKPISYQDVEDEIIDIDFNDPQVEMAATKIQAGFKGMQVRKKYPVQERSSYVNDSNEAVGDQKDEEEIDIDLDDPDVEKAATKIQAGFKGYKTRKGMKESDSGAEVAEVGQIAEEDNLQGSETVTENPFETKREDKEAVIDPDDPEVQRAATQIQAGFKGHRARKNVQEMRLKKKQEEEEIAAIDLGDPDVEMAATRIQAGYKGMRTRRGMTERRKAGADMEKESNVNKEEIDIDLNDPEVERAATKIQAGFKGMQARKKVSDLRDSAVYVANDEAIDIDLNDPQVESAATKIQAGFKGHRARKEVASMREQNSSYLSEPVFLEEDPESLTIIEEIYPKQVDEEIERVEHVADVGAVPFEYHEAAKEAQDSLEGAVGGATTEEEEDDLKKKGEDNRASTAGSERMEEGLVTGSSNSTMLQSQLSVGVHPEAASSLSSSQASDKMKQQKAGAAIEAHPPIMLYHYRGSHCSQKVLMYLYERQIDFTGMSICICSF